MNTISKMALVCAVTLFSAHATYGMKPKVDILPEVEALFNAFKNNNLELVYLLLEGDDDTHGNLRGNGIDFTLKNEYYWTLLHLASSYGRTALVQLIVKKDPESLKVKSKYVTTLDNFFSLHRGFDLKPSTHVTKHFTCHEPTCP